MSYEFSTDWVSNNMKHWPTWPDPRPPLRALEIGSFEGRSAVWMVENLLTHPGSRLTCVDHWKNADTERRFDQNILATGQTPKIQKIKEDAWRALTRLAYGFDLVYLDGPKEASAIMEAAVWSFRLLKPGGYLIFDDYQWTGPSAIVQPKAAIDGFLSAYAPMVEVVRKEWQVILKKRDPVEVKK